MKSKELFLANVKKYIRPQTDPVAIKLVFGDEQPPEGMKRPTENSATRLRPARAYRPRAGLV